MLALVVWCGRREERLDLGGDVGAVRLEDAVAHGCETESLCVREGEDHGGGELSGEEVGKPEAEVCGRGRARRGVAAGPGVRCEVPASSCGSREAKQRGCEVGEAGQAQVAVPPGSAPARGATAPKCPLPVHRAAHRTLQGLDLTRGARERIEQQRAAPRRRPERRRESAGHS